MSKKARAEARRLDTAQAARGLWLVKVPNYLSEAWEKAGQDDCVGVLKVTSKKTGKAEAQFCLSKELIRGGGPQLPQDHRINLSDTGTQSLCAFSEDQSSGAVLAEGRVLCRADVQPMTTDSALNMYMQLKKHQIHEAGKTKFTAQHLKEAPASSYKPVARHSADVEYERKKKMELKRARDDKGKVYDLLFNAFQHHQYYGFKDLVNITKQPPVYLKEVLKELCVYNTKAPHKYMWELKGEYKHTHSSSAASSD